MAENKKVYRCSFCGKTEENVKGIVNKEGMTICDICGFECLKILVYNPSGSTANIESDGEDETKFYPNSGC